MSTRPNSLRWNHTKEEIASECEAAIADFKARVDAVVNVEGSRSFENTVEPIALLEYDMYKIESNLTFYRHASASKELRDASLAAEEKFDAFGIDLWMRLDFYQAIQSCKDSGDLSAADAEGKRYLDRLIRDFERNGLKKSEEERKAIQKLQKDIADLERNAGNNINEDKTKVEFEEAQLEGLPEDTIKKLEKVEGKEGWRYVSMKYPEILPALKLCKNEEVRKKLDLTRSQKCQKENIPILEELVAKRHELALALDFTSYSAYILSIRMAKNPQNVQKFEEDLTRRLWAKGKQELERLAVLKREETGNPDAQMMSWDYSFYDNLLRKKFYAVDEEKIREYFPTDHVVQVTLDIYQELLSLKFTKLEDIEVWHEEASCYLVEDKSSGETLGHFYLDLYPREGKYGHAAVFPMLKRAKIAGKVIPAAAGMMCNFDKPTPEKPSILPHSDVVTFFHEFGHVMHGMCSHSNYARFSGTSVERDFVELPSQMLENWVWNKEILQRVSKHYQSGEGLPNELIDKKLEIKNLNEASFTLRQIHYGTFDFLLHSASDQTLLDAGFDDSQDYSLGRMRKEMTKDGFKVDTTKLWHSCKDKITLVSQQEGTNPAGDFGHIYGGYQSQYYGYLWSQVFSCDLYAQFEEKGVMNAELGMKYRTEILGPGGSRDSDESLKIFLGREPNEDAFLKQNGFV